MRDSKESEKKFARLTPSRIGQTVARRNDWLVNVPPETTKDDLINKEYWTHVANKLRPLDHVEVVFDDGSKWFEFMVLKANNNEAILKLLHEANFDGEPEEDVASEYEVKWGGPVAKFRIVRKSDGRVIEEGISTKEEAYSRLANHQKAVA